MTFSIVAWDPDARPSVEWGVAVASKFLAVGAIVPWAEAGAGAIATQAFANISYGPAGLERLRSGEHAAAVVRALTGDDAQSEQRQVGIVDARGGAETFTGSDCFDWAGGNAAQGYCCQGNILVGPEVVDAMSGAFESAEGELAVRLLAALRAGDEAGGDKRGRQSAALVVVREGGGYGGLTDLSVDLRIDDHRAPVGELERLLDLYRLYSPRPEELRFVDVDEGVIIGARRRLALLGYDAGEGDSYDARLRAALFAFVGTENLEERWTDEPRIEAGILDHLEALTSSRGGGGGRPASP
jgi:uncharacterized Ntn-hydrolase superfamily protein